MSTTGYKTRIYLNNGDGTVGKDPVTNGHKAGIPHFRPTMFLGDAADVTAKKATAEVVDINHDGRNDILVGQYWVGNNTEPDKVWINTGFTAFGVPKFKKFDEFATVNSDGSPDDTRYIRHMDIDGDGDLDYFEGNFRGSKQRIFLNRKF